MRPEHRELLGAVTHVDGSARLQIIDATVNERSTVWWTGFLTTDLDYLVVGDFLVRRRAGYGLAFDDFTVKFRPVARLTASVRLTSTGARTDVSSELHSVLEGVDGSSTLSEPLVDAYLACL